MNFLVTTAEEGSCAEWKFAHLESKLIMRDMLAQLQELGWKVGSSTEKILQNQAAAYMKQGKPRLSSKARRSGMLH